MAEKDPHAANSQPGTPGQGTANPRSGATEATIQSPGTYPPGEDPRRWRVLGVILTTIFMSLISVSIINVALPSIQQGLDATESDIQ